MEILKNYIKKHQKLYALCIKLQQLKRHVIIKYLYIDTLKKILKKHLGHKLKLDKSKIFIINANIKVNHFDTKR